MGNWEIIKNKKSTLTEEDAVEIKKALKDFRENFKMRHFF